jgi:hypothetical protein
MSRYDDICAAYRKSRQTLADYEHLCADFARDLVFGMIEYFEWPRNEEITYIPLGEDIDPSDKFYALTSAMRMDEQSFWHFGVEMKVHEGSGTHPVGLVLSFFIKKVGPNFIVKLGPKGKEIKIPEDKRGELGPFYEAIYTQIADFFARKYFQAVTAQEIEPSFITLLSSG